MSIQEIMIKVQNEMHARNERKMMNRYMMDLQAMEIKSLKEELLAMKKITLQIQNNWMHELATTMTILESKKETLIKTNVEMKSNL